MIIEQRTSLKGEISVPGDRSISHRAIIFGSLAKGTTEISGFSMREDCLSTIDCFRKMGISIEILPENKVKVHGKGLYGLKSPTTVLNTGKSGTAIRLLLGVLAGQTFFSTVVRDESSQKKPVGKVVQALRLMGANITGKDDGNYCPLAISPALLKGIGINLPYSDTYIKSPILIAGLYGDGQTTVIEAARSRDHSELMLGYFGAYVKVAGNSVCCQRIDNLYSQNINVPGDISIASYFITAGLLAPKSDIIIKNVGINPTRTGILNVYKSMGARIEFMNERTASNEKSADIRIVSSSLNGTVIEQENIPGLMDEIPLIILACVLADGATQIKGLWNCKIKESDRIKSVCTELQKMGAVINETADGLVIKGGNILKGTIVESSNDHSIAMTMVIAGLIASGETMIRKAQVIDAAYPEFLPVLNRL